MSSRFIMLSVAGVAVAAALVLPPRPAAGQVSRAGTSAAAPTPAPQASKPEHRCASDDPALFWRCAQQRATAFIPPLGPRTGTPDFSGYWSHAHGGQGRPRSAVEQRRAAWNPWQRPGPSSRAGKKPRWSTQPDGKLPLQPWAAAQRKENEAKYIDHNVHCFLSGVPRHMYEEGDLPGSPKPREDIAILSEEAHAFRVITMDSRPRMAQNVRLWLGDARGRWEGNTLVIETSNHNGRVFLDRRGTFYTEGAKVTERFIMLDRNTIAYGATVDDPLVYTRPFTIAFMLTRNTNEGFEIWEDACFEGEANYRSFTSSGSKSTRESHPRTFLH